MFSIRTTYLDRIGYQPVWFSRVLCANIFHSDISHPDGKGGRSVRQHFTSGYPIAGWERRMLQLLWIYISGPFDNAYLQSFFSLSIQCSGVLLNLPDISDRYFLDILGYFALDICCLNSQNLLVIHLSWDSLVFK